MSIHIGIDIGGSSIKAACLDGQLSTVGTVSSDRYRQPDRSGLLEAIQQCVRELGVATPTSIGLCLPGKMNLQQTAIELSVNLPALNGWAFDELLQNALGQEVPYKVISDADAAGLDYAMTYPAEGRTAAISIGTGVGLSVLDGTQFARIGNKGIGHLGLMDVGRHADLDRIDAHGVKNTLESYIGAPALNAIDPEGELNLDQLSAHDPAIRALVHALRVVHAIYQPDRIVLLGGVGNALKTHRELLHNLVCDGLTQLSARDWALEFGESHFHAAMGAAKYAAQSR